MEKWNKALDIPVEILFKYLCRDYRREQARTAELEYYYCYWCGL